jgi:hypothetical protein
MPFRRVRPSLREVGPVNQNPTENSDNFRMFPSAIDAVYLYRFADCDISTWGNRAAGLAETGEAGPEASAATAEPPCVR